MSLTCPDLILQSDTSTIYNNESQTSKFQSTKLFEESLIQTPVQWDTTRSSKIGQGVQYMIQSSEFEVSTGEPCLDGPHSTLALGLYDPPSPSFMQKPHVRTDVQPRCFAHGCNGRTFSSNENYRRHMREKDEQCKARCGYCLTVFTRKSNRDAHIQLGRCNVLRVCQTYKGEAIGQLGGDDNI